MKSKTSGPSKKPFKGSSTSSSSKSKSKNSQPQSKATSQVKTKRTASSGAAKKKQRTYTDTELGIPILNTIVPAGVQKPRGKKKGKVFVDDAESMLAIWSVVNAEKEGETESKMMKSRQLEEIREARRIEAEKRQDIRKEKLEDKKDSLRRKRRRKDDVPDDHVPEPKSASDSTTKRKKRVSFG